MKLTFFNAFVIFAIGMALILVGVFMKIQGLDHYNFCIFIGLAFEFLGTVWFVLSLYRRRKNL